LVAIVIPTPKESYRGVAFVSTAESLFPNDAHLKIHHVGDKFSTSYAY